MKLELHTLALKIFKICYEHSIHLDIEWVPRDRNTRADFISKLVNFDDWQVTEDVFKDLDSLCMGSPYSGLFCHVLQQKNRQIFF